MSTRFIAKAVLVAAPAFALFGCSSFPSNYGLDTGSATMVRQTCNEIMGLRVGPEAEACGGSLADTYRSLQNATLTIQADEACAAQGFSGNASEQAKCVVKYRRAEQQRALFTSRDTTEVPAAQPWQSYFSMNKSEQDERAELSCAQLGLHPATGGFWSCVTDLKYAIANIRFDTMP